MFRRAIPALSNTPESRSNMFLRPNASRAIAFASYCSTTCDGTAVASERRLHCCISGLQADLGHSERITSREGPKRLAGPGAKRASRRPVRRGADQPGTGGYCGWFAQATSYCETDAVLREF